MRRKIIIVALLVLPVCTSAADGPGAASPQEQDETHAPDVSPALDSRSSLPVLGAVGQIGGPVKAVAAANGVVYVSVGPRLVVMSVSESGDLIEMGASTALPSFIEDVKVAGTMAYVAAGEAGLYVLDVSDPAEPTVMGVWDSPGYARAVAVAGDRVFVADGPYGLRIVDVSDPSAPVETGWAYALHYAMDVAVSGNTVAVGAAVDGLLIVDATDPSAPLEVGSLRTSGCAFEVELVGQTAYLADGWEGVVTVDLSDPSSPAKLDTFATPGWAFDVAVEGGLAYVADAFGGLRVIDSSDPSSLQEAGSLEVNGDLARLVVDGQKAYAVDRIRGLAVIDVSDPARPVDSAVYSSLSLAEDVAVSGNHAYVAAGADGLHVIDVSDPANPRSVAQIDTQGYAVSVKVGGSSVFAATMHGSEGLDTFDVSDPSDPTRVSFFQKLHGPYRDLDLANGIACLADEWGLALVDISDPASPFEAGWIDLGSFTLQAATNGVGVEGTLAAVTQAFEGVSFVDASDPANPTLLGTFKEENVFLQDAVIRGDRAYLAAGDLLILDISDPSRPQELGSSETAPGASSASLAVDGDCAYVANAEAGVTAVDISDAARPTVAARHDSLGSAARIFVHDDLVYVADTEGGLLILETMVQDGPDTAVRHEQPASQPARPVFLSKRRQKRPGRFGPHGPHSDAMSSRPAAPRASSAGPPRPLRLSREASTCLVTTSADSGSGSLRWCLETVEQGDSILFDSTAFPPQSPAVIALVTPLPHLTQGDLTIDASDAGVILSGETLIQDGHGIDIERGGNTIRGLQIVGFPGAGVAVGENDNIIGGSRLIGAGPVGQGNVLSGNPGGGVILGGYSNIVSGNLIGVDVSGTAAMPNGGHGVHVFGSDNLIGGDSPGTGNVISGNSETGLSLHFEGAFGNSIIGNYIGTDISGTYALPNVWSGVTAEQGAYDNLIARNVISGNAMTGVTFSDPGSSYNVVIDNTIGLDASGTNAVGNGVGVAMGFWGAAFNRVGGSSPDERNVIGGNREQGVGVGGDGNLVLGNFIGTDFSGTIAVSNKVGVVVDGDCNLIGAASQTEGNLVSGNERGIRLGGHVRNNWIAGNRIGVDSSGTAALPNTVGVSIKEGGSNFLQLNQISGNLWYGVFIERGADKNVLRSNRMGTGVSGATPVPNGLSGVLIESALNRVGGLCPSDGNVIAFNGANGIEVLSGEGNSILGNSIFANGDPGIRLTEGGNDFLPAPTITHIWPGSVWGTTCGGCTVEIFSDEDRQGKTFEGRAVADAKGAFVVLVSGPLAGPNLTATATDSSGSTSEFSEPIPLRYLRRVRRRLTSP